MANVIVLTIGWTGSSVLTGLLWQAEDFQPAMRR